MNGNWVILTKSVGSSTETVAFQAYEILKTDHDRISSIFLTGIKNMCLKHHFQYLAQFTAPSGGAGAIQIFSIPDYGT